jgi:hypothetical protein
MDLARAMEFLLEQQAASQARFDAQMTEIRETLAQSVEIGRRTREELRRAVRLGIQEARAERTRRKEADEKLAAGQESLRQSLQAFIDLMKQPRNGHDAN